MPRLIRRGASDLSSVSPEVPTSRIHNDRLRTTWLGDAGLVSLYEVEIDGELYIVTDRGNGGTAIIPKIRPMTD